jgi:hypothetical protein
MSEKTDEVSGSEVDSVTPNTSNANSLNEIKPLIERPLPSADPNTMSVYKGGFANSEISDSKSEESDS